MTFSNIVTQKSVFYTVFQKGLHFSKAVGFQDPILPLGLKARGVQLSLLVSVLPSVWTSVRPLESKIKKKRRSLTWNCGELSPIISEIKGKFVLFIEAPECIFKVGRQSPPLVGWGWGCGVSEGALTYTDGGCGGSLNFNVHTIWCDILI